MKLIDPLVEVEKYDGLKIMKNIERACRTCYRSEGLITDTSYKGLIKGCINRGHGCYDDATEVLTSEGWKFWKDVVKDDYLATLDKNWNLSYVQPTNLIKYRYNGDMYKINCTGVDLFITPNHKVYYCEMQTRQGRKRDKEHYKLEEVEKVYNIQQSFYKSCESVLNTENILNNDILKFIGFCVGDAYYKYDSGCVEFSLKKERKIRYLKDLCSILGYKFVENETKNTYKVYTDILDKYFIYTTNGDKYIPIDISKLNNIQANCVLDGLMQSDGCSIKISKEYTTTSKYLADQIQQLCLHCGIYATIRYSGKVKYNTSGYAGVNSKPVYVLTIGSNRYIRPIINKNNINIFKEEYNGYVYCAELPYNHTLYVRRNGKSVWSGNSVLEHEKITVRITADIGTYKDLTRHRFASFSVESTRYCNYGKDKFNNEIKIIEPCHIEKDTNIYTDWYSAMQHMESFYMRMVDNGAKPDQLRMILPHSTAAQYTMTANIREWRHILDLRTKKMTHPSIRQILIPLLLKFKRDMPELFENIEYDTEFDVSKYATLKDIED